MAAEAEGPVVVVALVYEAVLSAGAAAGAAGAVGAVIVVPVSAPPAAPAAQSILHRRVQQSRHVPAQHDPTPTDDSDDDYDNN